MLEAFYSWRSSISIDISIKNVTRLLQKLRNSKIRGTSAIINMAAMETVHQFARTFLSQRQQLFKAGPSSRSSLPEDDMYINRYSKNFSLFSIKHFDFYYFNSLNINSNYVYRYFLQ